MKNRPYLHYPHDRPYPMPGSIFPGIFPWDPLRLRPGTDILIYPKKGNPFPAELLTASFYPSLREVPGFAFLWVTNRTQERFGRPFYHQHFQHQYDLIKTPFGLYTFQRHLYILR